MLQFDADSRITASQALLHAYFQGPYRFALSCLAKCLMAAL